MSATHKPLGGYRHGCEAKAASPRRGLAKYVPEESTTEAVKVKGSKEMTIQETGSWAGPEGRRALGSGGNMASGGAARPLALSQRIQ